MRRSILTAMVIAIGCASYAQQQLPDPHYTLVKGGSMVQSKNYYLLTLMQEDKELRSFLEKDTLLSSIATGKLNDLSGSLKTCNNNALCFTEKMKFSEKEIIAISARLSSLYAENNALGKMVRQDLIPSGTYVLYNNSSPRELLVKAWEQDANGINFIIGVYGEGAKANYPLIDSISFNVKDGRYGMLVYDALYTVLNECRDDRLFFAPSLTGTLHFLEINERNNAADYEPMTASVNKAAYEKVRTTRWETYKYSVILIPGAGPESPTVPLSAEGMLRCRMGAMQYRKGLAPFIVVSGGKVHPYKTPYCEAIEMKRFLVQELHIPESAVIVDPHARHTTTNMRNCARIIFRYGMPFSKPCITSTSRGQSLMIATTLAARCQKELNEVPFKNGLRLSETEMEFYPSIDALHLDPDEPMDP